MSTYKTQLQNIARFPDNIDGDILASDGRNLIASLYPYQSANDPTANDDNVNTADEPNATGFDTGSWWLNTVSADLFYCLTGVATAALWVKMYPQSSGGAGVIAARLLNVGEIDSSTFFVNTTITTSTGNSQFIFDVPADTAKMGVPMVIDGGGFPAGSLMVSMASGTVGESDTVSTAGGAGAAATFNAAGYSWVEIWTDPSSGEMVQKPGGLSGTYTTAPAIPGLGGFIDPGKLPADVILVPQGIVSGLPFYYFGSGGIEIPLVFGSPSQTAPTVVNYYGNTTYPTTVNLNVNVNWNYWNGTSLVPIFVGPTINPILIPPSSGSYWIPFDIDYTDDTLIGSDYYYFLCTLPPNSIALRICQFVDVAFNGMSFVDLGFIKLTDTTRRNNLGSFRYFNTGALVYQFSDVPVDVWSGVLDGTYSLGLWIGTTPATAGHIHGAMEVISL